MTHLSEIIASVEAGDREAQWFLSQHLRNAILDAAARAPRVKRQLAVAGVEWKGVPPTERFPNFAELLQRRRSHPYEELSDLLSKSRLGAMIVEFIPDLGWDDSNRRSGRALMGYWIDTIVLKVRQGSSPEEAISKTAFYALRRIREAVDPAEKYRKDLERGIARAGDRRLVERIVAVGFNKDGDLGERIKGAREFQHNDKPLPLIGEPIRIQELRSCSVVFVATAQTKYGAAFGTIFRDEFIGPAGSLLPLVKSSRNPWKELNAGPCKEDVRRIAVQRIAPIAPVLGRARGTVSPRLQPPSDEILRVIRQLAEALGRPTVRESFLAGLWATMSRFPLQTLAVQNDRTNALFKDPGKGAKEGRIRSAEDALIGHIDGDEPEKD